ncbi:MAG: DUF4838 domain-containing protein [Armatimonadota bacterium]
MITVHVLDEDPAVRLAGEELARCLTEMTGREVGVQSAEEITGEEGIWLGTGGTVGEAVDLPDVRDPAWDDAFCTRSLGDGLVIGGVNPRSVLMGAYQYLRELGAEWLWPGDDGEVLPELDEVPLADLDLTWVAPNRHRGVCIEGAPALQHVLDMVEWMPRVGYNAYFLQFQVSSYFWRLWYEHRLNPEWDHARELTEEECEELDRQVIEAVKRRGLLLHQVGHGWTAAALGLPTNGWVTYDGPIPEEDRELLAEVNGERKLWGNIPINTELCYSNPEARERLIDTVVDWAEEHPEVDALHFWLSDAPNNHCECAGCRELSPADWYARLANELSPRIAAIAPDMKIVLLAYHDLLWPPERVELDLSHSNLVSMFAPITRCYAHSLADPECDAGEKLQRPERNQMQMPRHNQQLVELWRVWGWEDQDNSFCFDYHFMWPWMGDRLSIHLCPLMPRDIEDYAALGLGGLMNCGAQRTFYPTGWPYWETARTLCGQQPTAQDREAYFQRAYADGAGVAMRFLDGVAEAAGAPRHGPDWWQQVEPGEVGRLQAHLDEFEDAISERADSVGDGRQAYAWSLLRHYHRLLRLYATAQEHHDAGRMAEAAAAIEAAEDFLRETEPETARALDGFTLLRYLAGLRDEWR